MHPFKGQHRGKSICELNCILGRFEAISANRWTYCRNTPKAGIGRIREGRMLARRADLSCPYPRCTGLVASRVLLHVAGTNFGGFSPSTVLTLVDAINKLNLEETHHRRPKPCRWFCLSSYNIAKPCAALLQLYARSTARNRLRRYRHIPWRCQWPQRGYHRRASR